MTPLKLACLLCALVLLQGCAPTIVSTAQPFCRAMTQTCINNDDVITEGTAQQIEGNNLARERLCGRPKKCKA